MILIRLWLDGEYRVWITKPSGVGSQGIGGIGQLAQFWINISGKIDQHLDVVRFLNVFPVMDEEGLYLLFRRLLAMVCSHIIERLFTRRDAPGGFQIAPRFNNPSFGLGNRGLSHKSSAPGSG